MAAEWQARGHESGIWLSPEPLAQLPSFVVSTASRGHHVVRFSYAENDPVGHVDPTGLNTLKAKVVTLILAGEFGQAAAMWELETGGPPPAWLLALSNLGDKANRVPGQCVDVARRVFDAFRNLGWTRSSCGFLRLHLTASRPRLESPVTKASDRIYVVNFRGLSS